MEDGYTARKNYSIGEILEKFDKENGTPEIAELKKIIDQYIEETENQISFIKTQVPGNNRIEAMKWIESNVSEELKPYVRKAYFGTLQKGDVLKKRSGKYKTISEIGVAIVKPDHSEKVKGWMRYWHKKAKKVKGFLEKNNTGKPLRIFDTHCHYYLDSYEGCRNELLDLLKNTGVRHIVMPAVQYLSNFRMLEMEESCDPGFIHMVFGPCHPRYLWKEVEYWDEDRWEQFRALIQEHRPVAIGEIGLDYYSYPDFKDDWDRAMQMNFFIRGIEEANRAELPVILHIRPVTSTIELPYNTDRDAIEILRQHPIKNGAVIHCFKGRAETMKAYMEVGVSYFGIGGMISYGFKDLTDTARIMPLESLQLETDSPFVKPFRRYSEWKDDISSLSAPNTSLSIYEIALEVSKIRGCSPEEILEAAYDNALRFFRLQE
ncbi:MAG: TatD family hydrolase [Lachnospiraceae bacterium]|nr:TatD family hydrolase [Lachnospiraceae bacterium]